MKLIKAFVISNYIWKSSCHLQFEAFRIPLQNYQKMFNFNTIIFKKIYYLIFNKSREKIFFSLIFYKNVKYGLIKLFFGELRKDSNKVGGSKNQIKNVYINPPLNKNRLGSIG